jgi:hypothetical protein
MEPDTIVDRLAVRCILMVTSPKDHPELVRRATDFLQDKGAVGMLLVSHRRGDSLEAVARQYWNSRLEKSAARLEDLTTAFLISVASTVVATIAIEFGKIQLANVRRIFKTASLTDLERIAAQGERARVDLDYLLRLYLSKARGEGVSDERIAKELYQAIDEGLTMAAAIESHPKLFPPANFGPLQYLRDAARGVVLTEMEHNPLSGHLAYQAEMTGLPFCNRLGFGEVIPPFFSGKGGCADVIGELDRLLSTTRLHPQAWPRGIEFSGASPKVLVLDEELFLLLDEANRLDLFEGLAGVISTRGGMTSHVAVFCRGCDVPAIGFPLSANEAASARFALINDGRLTLYRDRPNFTLDDFHRLLSMMRRPSPSG